MKEYIIPRIWCWNIIRDHLNFVRHVHWRFCKVSRCDPISRIPIEPETGIPFSLISYMLNELLMTERRKERFTLSDSISEQKTYTVT